MSKIIDGKQISAEIKEELKLEVAKLKEKDIIPGLTVVIVGNNPASEIYVRNKKKTAEEIGIHSEVHNLEENVSQEELENLVQKLNQNEKVHGILVQLPLPKHLDEERIINLIDPKKDVDCFHPENVGKLMIGKPRFLPCTPAGIMELLKRTDINVEGKHAVIVGRSNIVGKPIAMMLINASATVTVCNSKTKNLKEECLRADILISATGQAGLITKDMIKQDAVVIDVGINRLENGKIVGDVDFEEANEIASAITPVPGGVGPMTIVMLMKNTMNAASLRQKLGL